MHMIAPFKAYPRAKKMWYIHKHSFGALFKKVNGWRRDHLFAFICICWCYTCNIYAWTHLSTLIYMKMECRQGYFHIQIITSHCVKPLCISHLTPHTLKRAGRNSSRHMKCYQTPSSPSIFCIPCGPRILIRTFFTDLNF